MHWIRKYSHFLKLRAAHMKHKANIDDYLSVTQSSYHAFCLVYDIDQNSSKDKKYQNLIITWTGLMFDN